MKKNASTSLKLLVSALIALALTGCVTTTEYVEVTPTCQLPIRPLLPEPLMVNLAVLDDLTYWQIDNRDRLLTDWALDLETRLAKVCGVGE